MSDVQKVSVNSKYTKVFTSNDLTDSKYDDILNLAMTIRDCKNEASRYVSENLMMCADMTKDQLRTHLEHRYHGNGLSSNFYRASYTDVATAYENKFKSVVKKVEFYLVTDQKIEFYSRNTKYNKKGDIKSLSFKTKKTNLTASLTFLARYGTPTTVEYLRNKLIIDDDTPVDSDKKLPKSKRKLYENVLYHIEKYGFDRLYRLATSKRNRTIQRYNKPIEFKKLTLRGRSRLNTIIEYNKNPNSVISTFVSISWREKGQTMHIPIKYSKKHYGDIEMYTKNSNDYEYVITFNKKGKIQVNICVDGLRDAIVNSDVEDRTVGVDLNVKHNLFALSDGETFDYDRKLMAKLANELTKIDELKKIDENYVVGKRRQKKVDALREAVKHSNQRCMVGMCKYMQSKNYDHAVFEDLDNSFGKCYIKDENDLKITRLMKELKLSSKKDEFKNIAVKYGIAVSTVHAPYTSITCSNCQYIDKENRLSQEEFECLNCGHKMNADHNSARTIEFRVVSTVLRNLLKQDAQLNTFKPKPMKRWVLKDKLIEAFPTNPSNNGGTVCV
jgi:transposase